jgi:PAS domain S-box-containing protein
MVAADDTDEIIAANRPAVELLGYDDEAELVGRRIVAIIPERYRQAHLAGFTLHFLNGRRPLLDGAVAVPALRRDGSEITVELLVRAQQAPGGGTVFLAELRSL